jgi:hypothetical protein
VSSRRRQRRLVDGASPLWLLWFRVRRVPDERAIPFHLGLVPSRGTRPSWRTGLLAETHRPRQWREVIATAKAGPGKRRQRPKARGCPQRTAAARSQDLSRDLAHRSRRIVEGLPRCRGSCHREPAPWRPRGRPHFVLTPLLSCGSRTRSPRRRRKRSTKRRQAALTGHPDGCGR